VVKIKGLDKHRKRLKSLQDIDPAAKAGLIRAAKRIEEEAKRLIGGSHGGVPSLPGQPPHGQTGALVAGIVSGPTNKGAHVTSHDPASASLEFGRSDAAERPFLRPAVQKSLGDIAKDVAQEVSIKLRRGR